MAHPCPTTKRARAIGLTAWCAVSLLAACAPAPSIALVLDHDVVELIRGGEVRVVVDLVRTGSAGADVTLNVTGLPASVHATFSPVVLSGTTLQSTLTLQADAASTEATHTITVHAVGPGLAAEAEAQVEVVGLTVHGTVVFPDGSPWEGIDVTGPTGSAVTAADGTFALQGLAVPYDLALSRDTGSDWVHVFEGLTTASPVLEPYAAGTVVFLANTASVSGTLAGSAMPVAAGHAARVCIEGTNQVAYGCQELGPGDTAYDVLAIWTDQDTLDARLHVLAYEQGGAGDPPAGYDGYVQTSVSVMDGDTPTLDLALAPVTSTVLLEGSVTVAGGGTPDRIYAGVRYGPNLTTTLFQGGGTNDFAVTMPSLPGATFDVVAVGSSPSRWTWRTEVETDAGSLTLRASPTLASPMDAAAGVDLATVFDADVIDDGVVTFVWEGAAGAPTFALTTERSEVTIPDGAPYGIPLPPAAAYEWHVFQVDATDVDAASALGYGSAFAPLTTMSTSLGGPPFAGDGAIALSTVRTFTTAP